MIHAQEVPAVKTEQAGPDKGKAPVVAQDKTSDVQQPAADEKELAEGQDVDFEAWLKSLESNEEMTDEEKAQFLAEVENELNAENAKSTGDSQPNTGRVQAFEDQKAGDSVVKAQVDPLEPKADSIEQVETKTEANTIQNGVAAPTSKDVLPVA
jgi:hypothetical protein